MSICTRYMQVTHKNGVKSKRSLLKTTLLKVEQYMRLEQNPSVGNL